MASFFSGVWDFIVWLFPWALLGVGVFSYHVGIGIADMQVESNKAKAREYLFISIAIGIVAGIVTPIYLRTSSYWRAPLFFWSGFLILLAIVVYAGGDFWEGVFGLGNASLIEYILSFYNEANQGIIVLLRMSFLFFVVFAGINFAQFLNSVTKRKTKKKSSRPHKPEIEEVETNQRVDEKEVPTPQESDSAKTNKGKVDVRHGDGWEKILKIIASILGIILLLFQLVGQAFDILKKIP